MAFTLPSQSPQHSEDDHDEVPVPLLCPPYLGPQECYSQDTPSQL